MKLLYAEDERAMSEAVVDILSYHKYGVDAVYDGADALYYAEHESYDGIILDVMMPKLSGLEVLTALRQKGITTPVLLLTAKGELSDRIEGLDAGADDYLPKPFAMKELLARVGAMTRRRTAYDPARSAFGDFTLDGETLELRAENAVRLSLKEYELLRLFMTHAERALDEAFLLEHIWPREQSADGDTVFLYVSYLRRKLAQIASRAEIAGERGGGYRLTGNGGAER